MVNYRHDVHALDLNPHLPPIPPSSPVKPLTLALGQHTQSHAWSICRIAYRLLTSCPSLPLFPIQPLTLEPGLHTQSHAVALLTAS